MRYSSRYLVDIEAMKVLEVGVLLIAAPLRVEGEQIRGIRVWWE